MRAQHSPLDVEFEPHEALAGLGDDCELADVLQQSIRAMSSDALGPLNVRIRELVLRNPELLYQSLTKYGQSFMVLACLRRGNLEAARFALEQEKASAPAEGTVKLVDQAKPNGATALFAAVYFGYDVELMKLLVNHGADPLKETRGRCRFFHNAIFGAAVTDRDGRRRIYQAFADFFASKCWDEKVRPLLPDADLANQMRACPHHGWATLRQHASADPELIAILDFLRIPSGEAAAAMDDVPIEAPIAMDGYEISMDPQPRTELSGFAKRLLDRAFAGDFRTGMPVYKVPGGPFTKLPFTPRNIFFQRIPEIGFEALFVDDTLCTTPQPPPQPLDPDVCRLGPVLDDLKVKWQEAPSNPRTKSAGEIGMTSYTLKLEKQIVMNCGHEPYLEPDREPGKTKSKVSVRVYFLYNEEEKQNVTARFVKVCPATNAGNAGGNRGRKKQKVG